MKQSALFVAVAACLFSCSKNDIPLLPNTAPATLTAVLTATAPPAQLFTIDLSQAQVLHTSKGATLTFGANAFVLPNGAVATGQATLRVREIYTVADMLLARMPTTTYFKGHLVSAGELNVQAWQGNARLQWNPSLGAAPRLAVPVPAAGLDTTRMLLWQQPAAANPALGDSVGWQPVWNQGGQVGAGQITVTGSTSSFYEAVLPLDSISWINFDQYWRGDSSAPWSWNNVRVPAGASETLVYFRPVGYTSLCRSFGTFNDPTLWSNHFPNGTAVQVIAMQKRDGQLYFGTQQYTWQENTDMTPPLSAVSATELVQRIRQL